jgi:lysozyme
MKDDSAMTVSAKGLDLIKHFEGFFPKAYLCPAKVWTIGWGHTGKRHNDGTVTKGRVITRAEGERLLAEDLESKYARDVRRLVNVRLSQGEFDALVSFHFNTGALGRSTLLRKLNEGNRAGAAQEFGRWTRGGGRVLPGLVRRRKAERHLFETGEVKYFQ